MIRVHRFLSLSLVLCAAGLSVGCDDATAPVTEGPPVAGQQAPAGGGAEGTAMPPTAGGQAGTPPPGGPAAGGPGGGSHGNFAPGEMPNFGLAEGEGVQIGGTIAYDGDAQGTLRLDVVTGTPGGMDFKVLHADSLEAAGEWSLRVPENQGAITVVGFIDTNGNGPDPTEPGGFVADIQVADQDMTGLTLTLTPGGAQAYGPQTGGAKPPIPGEPMPGGAPPAGGEAQPPAGGAPAGG